MLSVMPTTSTTSGGVRARARAAITTEIKDAAKRQIAEGGAAGLSLRAVAREIGMVSSAVYRYFPSRDELLTALIIDAYEDVAEVAEQAVAAARGEFLHRWLALARAIRQWATDHPHDYALVYGSPVPGYQAPADTIPAALRVSLVPLRLLEGGVASGAVSSVPTTMPRAVRRDLTRLRDEGAPGVPDDVLSRGLAAWTEMFGLISFELFGHLHNVVEDYDAFFDHQMKQAALALRAGS
jgi:AcrR family transcriptional regulator